MHPKTILDQYGISPKKSLGQNFIYDDQILLRIIQAAELSNADAVLEVGPGVGNMTRLLAEQAGRMVAVELDSRLIPILQMELEKYENIEVIQGDI